ncbi:MAG: CoA transferase [Chloroflexi bacterium]|nr:CoA transferase [Chloroflexota bacterium]
MTTEKMVLEGIRVLDLTRAWAGPLAVRLLADMGAQVIKIERPTGRGVAVVSGKQRTGGVYPGGEPGAHPWQREGIYNKFNRNRLSLAINLTAPQAVAVFKDLARVSDVVVDNFSARVMDNLGLGYKVLSAINPALIQLQMPAFGMTGPYRHYVTGGSISETFAGLSWLMGYPDRGPLASGARICDPIAGLMGCSAVLTALRHRRRSGHGQHIDLSHGEAITTFLGEAAVGYVMTGRLPERLGNRHPTYAPHNIYRCRGEDSWVTITVTTDEEWGALCQAIGQPELARDERFAEPPVRWQHQDELDSIIEAWTSQRDHHEVMHHLQRQGVIAAAVLDIKEMLEDPQLQARGFYVSVDQPGVGPLPYPGLPIKFSRGQRLRWDPCPDLGEHNRWALQDLLGYGEEEVQELELAGTIVSRPPGNLE